MQRALALLTAGLLVAGACSSSSHARSSTSKAGFCAAARRIKAENSRPVAQSSPAEQRQVFQRQFGQLRTAATLDEGKGWADAKMPIPRSATAAADAILRTDCALSVDIFGRTVTSKTVTETTTP